MAQINVSNQHQCFLQITTTAHYFSFGARQRKDRVRVKIKTTKIRTFVPYIKLSLNETKQNEIKKKRKLSAKIKSQMF